MPPSAYFVGKIVLVAVVATVQQVLLLAVGVLFYGLDLPTEGSRWLTYALGQRARHLRLHAARHRDHRRSSRTAGPRRR